MSSETEESIVEIEISEMPKRQLRSFALYEQYSHADIAQTIRIRKDNYEKADLAVRRKLEWKSQQEVESFCQWLEQTQNIGSARAHYYATSLKSILLGLPIGIQIAQLFGAILDQNPPNVP